MPRLGTLGAMRLAGGVAALAAGSFVWQNGAQFHTCEAQSGSAKEEQGKRLRQVVVLFRHGARTPLHGMPGKGFKAEHWDKEMCQPVQEFHRAVRLTELSGTAPAPVAAGNEIQMSTLLPGGCHIGCLTQNGRKEMFELGQALRRRYVDQLGFLGPFYDRDDVFIRSTHITRTIESARMVAAGLFGTEGPFFNIRVSPLEEEIMFSNSRKCPRLGVLFKQNRKQLKLSPAEVEFKERCADALGVTLKEVRGVAIRDVVFARQAHGKSIPSFFMDPDNRDVIDQLAVKEVLSLFQANLQETLSLGIGPLLTMIRGFLRDKASMKADTPRFVMLSAHDTTVLPILVTLGIFDGRWPPFAANVAFELWQDVETDEYSVRVAYNGEYQCLPASNGKHFVPFQQFEAGISEFIFEDWVKRCQVPREKASRAGGAGDKF